MKIYLDNNSTTPVDARVVKAMNRALSELWGNPASHSHAWGWQAEELVTIAREQVAELIGASPQEIIFTSGATESINLALLGFRECKLKRILYSAIEHKAVLDVTSELKRIGFEAVPLKVDRFGLLDLDQLKKELETPTFLVSVIAANNEIGTIQNLESIIQLCHSGGALVHLDIVQLLGKKSFSLAKYPADLFSLSAHKIYGPKGVGALYLNQAARDEIQPILFGGGHESGLRSGTLNMPGIVGFGVAAKLITEELDQISGHLKALTDQFYSALCTLVPQLKLNGHPTQRIPGNLNLTLEGVNAGELISKLALKIALSSTSACLSGHGHNSHVLEAIGLSSKERLSSVRVGIGRFNTMDEIDIATREIAAACQSLAHGQKR